MVQNKLHKLHSPVVFLILCIPITLLVADGFRKDTLQKDYATPQEAVQVESTSTIFTLCAVSPFRL